jgi:hypothetical protein
MLNIREWLKRGGGEEQEGEEEDRQTHVSPVAPAVTLGVPLASLAAAAAAAFSAAADLAATETKEAKEGLPLYGSWAGVAAGSWKALTTRIWKKRIRQVQKSAQSSGGVLWGVTDRGGAEGAKKGRFGRRMHAHNIEQSDRGWLSCGSCSHGSCRWSWSSWSCSSGCGALVHGLAFGEKTAHEGGGSAEVFGAAAEFGLSVSPCRPLHGCPLQEDKQKPKPCIYAIIYSF